MTALTLDLPDEKLRRLEVVARQRGTSVARLFEEMTSVMLAETDAETRFQLRAQREAGKDVRGLELLGKAAGQISITQNISDAQ
ncbi:toxin-antitoxin system HicB family antitoxin [Lamprobacter modestohalophilus]|uniref:Toxin-antitoxin system HicB family antitoxin n=1 Tax=Lamprobacter modestohalophilus TaxID=1064514 RepID=A0A9X1B7C4_9GAMM|nr:toxin-antitoxin system HicB family antitoxin [Lamprobacter modestohalophilus]